MSEDSNTKELEEVKVESEVELKTENKPVWIDFNRLLQLHGDVAEDLSKEFQAAALNLHAEDSEKPIYILLNTHGGDAYEGFAMHDLLNILPNEKVIICQGKVMSAGLILLASGDLRLSFPNTIFMIHEMATTIPQEMNDPVKIKQGLDSTLSMNDNMIDVITENCNLSREQVKEIACRETYFTAQEAMEWGFIDGIIGATTGEYDEESESEDSVEDQAD